MSCAQTWNYTAALGIALLVTVVLTTLVFIQPAFVDLIFRYPTVSLFKVSA